jgi:hypothetical protein
MKVFRHFSQTFNLIVSSVIGSFLGALTSLMVNCTLFEISMNTQFSFVKLQIIKFFVKVVLRCVIIINGPNYFNKSIFDLYI